MGISAIFGALLVRARENGVEFGRIATIGRQSLAIPIEDLKAYGRRLDKTSIDWPSVVKDGFAEAFFTDLLSATSVTSFDYSDYQGVDITHDFNQPVDESLHGRFDVLIDGGSLEHIFDIRSALSNYMSLVRRGGSVFLHIPANNLLGHGFYQFSPELFYRVFGPENGYKVDDILLTESPFSSVEISRRQKCYRTFDPSDHGKRARLVNDRPVMIFVHACRIEAKPILERPPMQSDYSAKWEKHEAAGSKSQRKTDSGRPVMPFRYVSWWEELRRTFSQRRRHSFRNSRFFERLDP